ncbi:MAG: hypothetical protein ACUVXG_11020 [Anaerolineae bacterium]
MLPWAGLYLIAELLGVPSTPKGAEEGTPVNPTLKGKLQTVHSNGLFGRG